VKIMWLSRLFSSLVTYLNEKVLKKS
jgi:hypothetical protein